MEGGGGEGGSGGEGCSVGEDGVGGFWWDGAKGRELFAMCAGLTGPGLTWERYDVAFQVFRGERKSGIGTPKSKGCFFSS